MANRLKSSASKKEKEKDSDLRDFKKESDAQLDVVGILKDERTWKIVGISFIILSLFLFISFGIITFFVRGSIKGAPRGTDDCLTKTKSSASLPFENLL